MKNTSPKEHYEQKLFCLWLRKNGIQHFAIPNGEARARTVAMRLKLEGVSPGVPDLFIPVPANGFHGLFIEMKRQKGGSVSEGQKKWLALLNASHYKAVVCKGCDAAIACWLDYSLTPTQPNPDQS